MTEICEHRRKERTVLAVLAVLVLAGTALAAALVADSGGSSADTYSGTCGTSATWSLDTSTGVLEIGGTGAMTDYDYNTTPWYSYGTSITSIVIDSGITSIGAGAFYGRFSLTSVTIPSNVTSIGAGAFESCRYLTSVTIPSSVTSIGAGAFESCVSLTSVTIPDSVTTISTSTFNNCPSLTSVTIPSNVTSIGAYAFDNCTSLTSVTIPSNVTSIGAYAFYSCHSVTAIVFNGAEPTLGASSFSLGTPYASASATIYSNGWADSSVFTSTVIESHTTLTYAVLSHSVTFEPENDGDPTVVAVSDGSTVGTWPDDPAKSGYLFTGWYTDSGCTVLFDTSAAITADLTLYAGYTLELAFTSAPSASACVTVSQVFDNAITVTAAGSSGYTGVLWDFGDGQTSTSLYATHIYAAPGSYAVTLTVTGTDGSDTVTQTVTASPVPTADGGGDGGTASGPAWYWGVIAAVIVLAVIVAVFRRL